MLFINAQLQDRQQVSILAAKVSEIPKDADSVQRTCAKRIEKVQYDPIAAVRHRCGRSPSEGSLCNCSDYTLSGNIAGGAIDFELSMGIG